MYFFVIFGNMDSIYHPDMWKATSHVEKNSIYRYNIINVSFIYSPSPGNIMQRRPIYANSTV